MYISDVLLAARNCDAWLILWMHRNVCWKIHVFDMMCTKYVLALNMLMQLNVHFWCTVRCKELSWMFNIVDTQKMYIEIYKYLIWCALNMFLNVDVHLWCTVTCKELLWLINIVDTQKCMLKDTCIWYDVH